MTATITLVVKGTDTFPHETEQAAAMIVDIAADRLGDEGLELISSSIEMKEDEGTDD